MFKRLFAILLLVACIPASALFAQGGAQTGPQGPLGSWLGVLQTPKGSIKVMLDFQKKDVGYSCVLYTPDENPRGFLADTVNVQSGLAKLVWPSLGVSFNAEITDTLIKGTLVNKAGSNPLNMYRSANWVGLLTVPDKQIKLNVALDAPKDGQFTGTITEESQKDAPGALTGVQSKDGAVFITVPAWGATIEGSMSKDGSEIAGFLKQGGAVRPIVLKSGTKKREFNGSFDVKGSQMNLVFRLANIDNKGLAAVFQSPNQGPDVYPIDVININDKEVSIGIAKVGGEFKGTLDDKGASMKGNWLQSGLTFPMTVERR